MAVNEGVNFDSELAALQSTAVEITTDMHRALGAGELALAADIAAELVKLFSGERTEPTYTFGITLDDGRKRLTTGQGATRTIAQMRAEQALLAEFPGSSIIGTFTVTDRA